MRECILAEDFYSHVVFSYGEDITEGISSHFHEQFELRFLFAMNKDGSVNYGKLRELRFSPPPKVIHPGMPIQDTPAHVTIFALTPIHYTIFVVQIISGTASFFPATGKNMACI